MGNMVFYVGGALWLNMPFQMYRCDKVTCLNWDHFRFLVISYLSFNWSFRLIWGGPGKESLDWWVLGRLTHSPPHTEPRSTFLSTRGICAASGWRSRIFPIKAWVKCLCIKVLFLFGLPAVHSFLFSFFLLCNWPKTALVLLNLPSCYSRILDWRVDGVTITLLVKSDISRNVRLRCAVHLGCYPGACGFCL